MPNSGDEGVIRYRVDQERTTRAAFTNQCVNPPVPLYPAWPGAQSFDDMTYDPGAPVVGSTGPLPGGDITDPATFYWRGMVDSVGDEWHILAVGDDDDAFQSAESYKASDGKIYTFVVNPTTPACQIIPNDSEAQFYTTPPKTYWVPVIRDQTSYLLGDCDIELAALGGAAVQYSMVVEGQAADWQSYTGPINTIAAGLASDTRYELKYRIGAAGPVKTRLVHFDPAYPSDSEAHPKDILWDNGEVGIQRVRDRLGREPYAGTYNNLLTKPLHHRRTDPYASEIYTGDRWCGIRMHLLASAFPLLMEDFDPQFAYYEACAAFLRNAMLDTFMNLDPIGLEGNWNKGKPCHEILHEGYYAVTRPLANALAYDWVIKDLRYPQHLHGFTAVEDYKLRDNLAAFANWTMVAATGTGVDANGFNIGMWDGAWQHGLGIIAAVMEDYDTDLYGTSGAPGGTFNAPRPWTPYPDYPHTWWEVLNNKTIPIPGTPNLGKRSTYWGLLNENYQWADRRGYWGQDMMGWLHYLTMNFRANFDGYHFPHLDEGVKRIAEGGQVMPLKDAHEGALEFYTAMMVNHHFPQIAPVELYKLNLNSEIYEKNIGFSLYVRGALGLCTYEDDWDQ